MKVLMPDEVKERNIITKSELQAVVKALTACLNERNFPLANRRDLKNMRSVLPKIEKTIQGMA